MKLTTRTLFKVLGKNGKPCRGKGRWPLPQNGRPGEWWQVEGQLEQCANGLHSVLGKNLIDRLGPHIYLAEKRGESVAFENEVLCREMRLLAEVTTWNERTARLFAADCAEHVLWIFECAHPNDKRPRNAIEAARAFARGEVRRDVLTAARVATGTAPWGRVRNAARNAAGVSASATVAATARCTARAAASAAAWGAARAGVVAAAAYGAAKDAAGAAAGAVVEWPAEEAAWDIAWDIAWDAERRWQTRRLFKYLRHGAAA